MKKLFQSHWHNINFKSFYSVSKYQLPDSTFYEKFYKIFHEKYDSFDDLDKEWVNDKLKYVEIFKKSSKFKPDSKILSIGCGTGLIERHLIQNYSLKNIEITEVSELPLKWIKKYISPQKIHIGYFPECIKHANKFDLILLTGIDYVFTDTEFITFIKNVNKSLKQDGECVLISISHIKNDFCFLLKKIFKTLLLFLIKIHNFMDTAETQRS